MAEPSPSRTLPAPAPAVSTETEPFWSAAAAGRLLLKRCLSCAAVVWYPRAMCPHCGSPRTEWFEGSGRGTVYSFTVNHKGEGAYRGQVYVLAYVELEEGPRLLTNVVEIDPGEVEIGMAVRAVFAPTDGETADGETADGETADGETALVRFAPAQRPSAGH